VVVCSAHIGVWELLPRLLAAQLPQCAVEQGRLVYR